MALGLTKLDAVSMMSAVDCPHNGAITWSTTPLNASTSEIYMDMILAIEIAFGADTTLDALLHLKYRSDNTDDVFTYAKTIPFGAASTSTIVSHRVPGQFDYLDVGVENQETTDYVVTATVTATGSKMTGLATV